MLDLCATYTGPDFPVNVLCHTLYKRTLSKVGVFDSFAGSGVDICIFSILTLLFRVTEKTATPTTVVLKGVNAVIGFFYRAAMMGDISEMAWRYFALSVPVAAIFGPLGSFLGSHLHRQLASYWAVWCSSRSLQRLGKESNEGPFEE
ncbi:hypothetical protein COOONC_03336 [Cooperia oncophora]